MMVLGSGVILFSVFVEANHVTEFEKGRTLVVALLVFVQAFNTVGNVKLFGSGTKVIIRGNVLKAPLIAAYPPSKSQDGTTTTLLCLAKGMVPNFVRFTWKEGENDVPDARKNVLEQEVEDGRGGRRPNVSVETTCNDTESNGTESKRILWSSDDSFELARSLYLASLIYTMMILKSVAFFGVASLHMYKRSTNRPISSK
ncbi:hypothetical protein SKAU_G00384710 [Synaphobranchus kaupii]|uniref:Ig-like domain-containing protein n=1 Tax=Synaphobranchus kaupii TaxID=118154 RepID=A0A9Q1EED9_SYNKA|nr:hypothetical protein SKAU_G00384710 [Synaphobranchus kaupii]